MSNDLVFMLLPEDSRIRIGKQSIGFPKHLYTKRLFIPHVLEKVPGNAFGRSEYTVISGLLEQLLGEPLDVSDLTELIEEILGQSRMNLSSASDDQREHADAVLELADMSEIVQLIASGAVHTAKEKLTDKLYLAMSLSSNVLKNVKQRDNLQDMTDSLFACPDWELVNAILEQKSEALLDLIGTVSRLRETETASNDFLNLARQESSRWVDLDTDPEVASRIAYLYTGDDSFFWRMQEYVMPEVIPDDAQDEVFDELMRAREALDWLDARLANAERDQSIIQRKAQEKIFSQRELLDDRYRALQRVLRKLKQLDELPLPAIEPYQRYVNGSTLEDDEALFYRYTEAQEIACDPAWLSAKEVEERFKGIWFQINRYLNLTVGYSEQTREYIEFVRTICEKIEQLLGLDDSDVIVASPTEADYDEELEVAVETQEALAVALPVEETLVFSQDRLDTLYAYVCVIAAVHPMFESNRNLASTVNSLLDVVENMGLMQESERAVYRGKVQDLMVADSIDLCRMSWDKAMARRTSPRTTSMWVEVILARNVGKPKKRLYFKPTPASKVKLAAQKGLDTTLHGDTGELKIGNDALLEAYGVDPIALERAKQMRRETVKENRSQFSKRAQ